MPVHVCTVCLYVWAFRLCSALFAQEATLNPAQDFNTSLPQLKPSLQESAVKALRDKIQDDRAFGLGFMGLELRVQKLCS